MVEKTSLRLITACLLREFHSQLHDVRVDHFRDCGLPGSLVAIHPLATLTLRHAIHAHHRHTLLPILLRILKHKEDTPSLDQSALLRSMVRNYVVHLCHNAIDTQYYPYLKSSRRVYTSVQNIDFYNITRELPGVALIYISSGIFLREMATHQAERYKNVHHGQQILIVCG